MGRRSRRIRERRRSAPPKNRPSKVSANLVLPTFLGGLEHSIVIRPSFPEGDDRNHPFVGGAPGPYRVVLTLSRPQNYPTEDYDLSQESQIEGDSHIAIAPPALPKPAGAESIRLYTMIGTEKITVNGLPNKRGFLGRLQAELSAADFKDALHRVHRVVALTLSNWSLHMDVPVVIWRTHVTEIATGAVDMSVQSPHQPMGYNLVPQAAFDRSYMGFVSLYREAINSTSPAYQFLCLFKIAEGIRLRRTRLAQRARERNVAPPRRPTERIPKDSSEFEPWLNAIFVRRQPWDKFVLDSMFPPNARGRKINDLVNKELTDLRNDVAHFLTGNDETTSLSADEFMHLTRVRSWLPLTRCIVRRLLKNDFPDQFLATLREDGTIDQEKAKAAARILGPDGVPRWPERASAEA